MITQTVNFIESKIMIVNKNEEGNKVDIYYKGHYVAMKT